MGLKDDGARLTRQLGPVMAPKSEKSRSQPRRGADRSIRYGAAFVMDNGRIPKA